MGLDSTNIVHVEKVLQYKRHMYIREEKEGKRARFVKTTIETKKKKIVRISNFSLDVNDTRCFDPKVYTLVRKCYNMRVKLYHILNMIHKVSYIPSIKWIYDSKIPRFKRNVDYLLLVLSWLECGTRYMWM